MKKQILVCLALALLFPSAIALNCNSLSGGDLYICNSIQSTNLSQAEKDLLIADIFNKNKTIPDFDFIYSWNTNLNIKNSPDNKYQSNGSIKNAWVKIISLMPSVLEDNILYIPEQVKILTRYNYDVVLPSGTASGDCKTSYSLEDKKESLDLYVNSQLIGYDQLTAFIIKDNPENLNFIARLKIEVKYKVDHYQNKKYCSGYKDGKCIKYKTVCEYRSTNYQTDTLSLTDNLNAKLYRNQLNSSFKITDKYNGITRGILEANNFTKLILSFNNSFYRDNRYIYSLNYTSQYYILTLKAEKAENIDFKNINVNKENNVFTFTVKDTSNCKIELFDHFNSITKNCDLSYNETNFSIKTDKTNYYKTDTIKVYITPSDVLVNVTYGNQSKLAKNYTEFKAVLYENKINAKLNGEEVNWFVNVNKKENAALLRNLVILFLLIYIFYKAAKVYYLKSLRT